MIRWGRIVRGADTRSDVKKQRSNEVTIRIPEGAGYRALSFCDELWELRIQVLVGGEGAGVGVEGTGAIEFGDLANVAEVVRGPLVEHLFERGSGRALSVARCGRRRLAATF
jgi:hypothetical protein